MAKGLTTKPATITIPADLLVKILAGFKDELEANELDKRDANVASVVDQCNKLIEKHTPRVTVYKLDLEGFRGPNVFTDLSALLREVEALLIEPDAETTIKITKDEMTAEQIEVLPEFEGY